MLYMLCLNSSIFTCTLKLKSNYVGNNFVFNVTWYYIKQICCYTKCSCQEFLCRMNVISVCFHNTKISVVKSSNFEEFSPLKLRVVTATIFLLLLKSKNRNLKKNHYLDICKYDYISEFHCL